MKGITYSNTISSAIREQLRDPEVYLDQIGSTLFSLFRMLGWWVIMTATYTSGIAILAFITLDLSAYSQHELQEGLRGVVILTGGTAVLACILSNAGKFRNIFSDRARDKVQRSQAIKDKIESQADTTERILVLHRLINATDVKRR